jgi:hypothetical protein
MEFIDISDWLRDENHGGIFPVGARDKQMVWSPAESIEGIKPNWPYLFKESIDRYPDQYWTELVAYIVSKYLDVNVPPVLPAITQVSDDIYSGSLIEWFYDVSSDRFIHGELYFKRLISNFDDKTGKHHNLRDFILIAKALLKNASLQGNPTLWLADMAIFDALIGNTDRHQENWGVVFYPDGTSELSPLFDNGTSLGHERFIENISDWDSNRIKAYILRGCHHLRFYRFDTKKRIKHLELINILAEKNDIKEYMKSKLLSFEMEGMLEEIKSLTNIKGKVPFVDARYNWIKKIIEIRYALILEELK